ncbi:hypothetical protein [Calothrix sp. UHCC 0171]|uniref:hypothetical protein n=1 Tax=Calothrix sp. UHCC 0171 TaxID=3110245 RepID=UPI002B2123B8|nr:hypothetical protein [Calothrix sp. UHCC 0171]MEA5574792.1 hypothetical protein [Calothrix sp. UHCC 0171]
MPNDATTYLLVGAALIVVSHYFYQQNQELNAKVNTCQAEFRGFREGVIYGK